MREHISHELDLVLDLAKKRGVEEPKRIVDAYVKNLETWEAHMAKVGNTTDAFAKALEERIYNRLNPDKF